MSFGLGNVLGLAGDAAGIIGTGGLDPGAWMDALDNVTGGSGGGLLGDLFGGGSRANSQMEQGMSQMLESMLSSTLQDASS